MQVFLPFSHSAEENIPVRKVPLPPENRRGWDYSVRNVRMMRRVSFCPFLSRMLSYIGEIGGVGTPLRQE